MLLAKFKICGRKGHPMGRVVVSAADFGPSTCMPSPNSQLQEHFFS
jgi:hypothetical protein